MSELNSKQNKTKPNQIKQNNTKKKDSKKPEVKDLKTENLNSSKQKPNQPNPKPNPKPNPPPRLPGQLPGKPIGKKPMNFGFGYIIGIVILVILGSLIMDGLRNNPPVEITMNEFKQYAIEGKIVNAYVHETEVVGTLIEGTVEGNKEFKFVIFPSQAEAIADFLEENHITVKMVIPNNSEVWGYILNFGTTILIIGLFWILLSRTMQGGGGSQVFNFGKSTAKLFMDNGPKITFKNVAGLHEAKTEMQEIVDFLRTPKKFKDIGAKIPQGILLVGPPGCGKTLMARAISGEAKVPFFTVSGSEFVEMFVGVGASRVRDLFAQAKKYSPSIIFVDEIDAVGRQRGAGLGGGHDEREQTLNQMLVEMDGFEANSGVIIIAATNRPDILDPALLRPGRFDRQIFVDMPDAKERKEILDLHSKNKPLDKDVNIPVISKQTAGFTGADLENLLNESAILSARRKKDKIFHQEIEESIDRILAGPEKKSRQITPHEKWAISLHETGHACVLRYFSDLEPVHKISIVSRGRALGYTMQLPVEDRFLHTSTELKHMLAGLLGGRASEELFLHDISTGASNDIEKVTEIATNMITKYGMSKNMGQRTFGKEEGAIFLGKSLNKERNYSEKTGYSIDLEIRELVDEAYTTARKIIKEKQKEIKEIAEILIEKENISGMELENILSRIRKLTPEEKTKNPIFAEIEFKKNIENEEQDSAKIEKESVKGEQDSVKDELIDSVKPMRNEDKPLRNEKPPAKGKQKGK